MKVETFEFFSALTVSVCVLMFVISTHAGWWDQWRGLDEVEKLAANIETSYAHVPRQVRPGESAWKPLLRLIRRYSIADLPTDKEPKVFGRFVAIDSKKIELGGGQIGEWTAPTRPIVLIYRDWPGQQVPLADYRIVGVISDLRSWINRSKDDFRFWVQDVFFASASLAVTIAVYWRKKQGHMTVGKKRK